MKKIRKMAIICIIILILFIIGLLVLKKNLADKIDTLENYYGEDRLLGVKIENQTNIMFDSKALEEIDIEISKDVLIYHTHATESYTLKENNNSETKEYETEDDRYNIISIGEYLKELLEKNEYNVTHDTGHYQISDNAESYRKSGEVVSRILSENKNIGLVIDVHRDYIPRENSADEEKCIEIDGKQVAKMRFVLGINENDKFWLHNLKLALELQQLSEKKHPGLFREIIIRNSDYNQDMCKFSILLEVGETRNTQEEAKNAIEYFVKLLNEVE